MLVLGALVMPLFIGGAGLALDTVQISLTKRQLQRAADSAALAAARSVQQSGQAAAAPAVTRDLQVNDDVSVDATPVVGTPTAGDFANNPRAVRVQLRTTQSLTFFSFFGTEDPVVTAEATAAVVSDGTFCMLSLEDGTSPGVTVGGTAEIDLGCGISTNSRAAEAISAGGNSRVRATPIMAVGGLNSGDTNFVPGTQFAPYAVSQNDPFGSVPNPTPPPNCPGLRKVAKGETLTLGPATAPNCFRGMEIRGTLVLLPGTTLYIDGADFEIPAQGRVTGTESTILLTSRNATSNPESVAEFKMNAQAELSLTAPKTGPYAGIAMFEDRRAPIGRTIRFNGGSETTIDGAMYFPRAYFEYNGGANMAASCLQLIGRRLDFRGNGVIRNQCDANDNSQNFRATFVRLVA
jgi:Flp pilus assembly protein TadG